MIPLSAEPMVPEVLNPLLQYGLPGVVILLFLIGWIIPKSVYETLKTELAEVHKALATEQAAHQLTRATLAEANGRADAAVEAARTAASTLQALRHLSSQERQ